MEWISNNQFNGHTCGRYCFDVMVYFFSKGENLRHRHSRENRENNRRLQKLYHCFL